MMSASEHSTPNVIKERDPEVFNEVKEFRARFEDILLDKLDNVLDNPRYRDRGNFLPRDDVKTIARVLRVLTRESWNEEHFAEFHTSWPSAMRSDFFAEAFASIRFRVENAVNAAHNRLTEKNDISGVTQGTLWYRRDADFFCVVEFGTLTQMEALICTIFQKQVFCDCHRC